jgi:hypothetical protein
MPAADTVVVGAINHHEWPVVAPWIRSLRGTGFTGRVMLVAYEDIGDSVIQKMQALGVEIHRTTMEISVNRGRFKDFAVLLAGLKPETLVVATDVRDVVFQTSPESLSALLDPAAGHDIAVSSEGWRYCDSEWNLKTLKKVFPDHESAMREAEVYCSGVIVGTAAALTELSARIWQLSSTAPGFNGDQVAMNIALREPAFASRTRFLGVTDGRIFHARATWMRTRLKQPATHEPRFSMLRGVAFRSDGAPVDVLHQYTEGKFERMRVLSRHGCLWAGLLHRLLQTIRPESDAKVYWKTAPAAPQA